MKAIEIIGRLRERYSNKYTKTPNHNKDHYINWLQDEYAELVMKQANDAERSSDKCHIQNVSNSVCPINNAIIIEKCIYRGEKCSVCIK